MQLQRARHIVPCFAQDIDPLTEEELPSGAVRAIEARLDKHVLVTAEQRSTVDPHAPVSSDASIGA